jgi:hypothetical protein
MMPSTNIGYEREESGLREDEIEEGDSDNNIAAITRESSNRSGALQHRYIVIAFFLSL